MQKGANLGVISESWQKNLFAIFIAEFLVIMGHSSVSPFMPLFVQKLGNFTNLEAAFWAGITTGVSGLGMFLTAPLWGNIADRWGRKSMVLRAMFGGSIIVALTGLAPNIYYLVVMRFVFGMFAGSVAASSALIAANTPKNKIPFAMGLLMAAAFGGQTLGPMFGGFLADSVGYENTFFITSAVIFAGSLIVLLFVEERFERPVKGQSSSWRRLWGLAKSREMILLLILLFALNAGLGMISPIIPVVIKDLDPGGKAASSSGLAIGFLGLVTAISSVITGRLGEKFTLKKILFFSCIVTGLLYLPPIWASTLGQFTLFIALMGLFKGGMVTIPNALVGLSVDPSQQGIAYGLAQSAKALGNAAGPFIGGSLAPFLGLRTVFAVAGGLFLLVGIAVARFFKEKPTEIPKTPH
jgi:DHA1 family multidrug resistance protein-like MFS transporter